MCELSERTKAVGVGSVTVNHFLSLPLCYCEKSNKGLKAKEVFGFRPPHPRRVRSEVGNWLRIGIQKGSNLAKNSHFVWLFPSRSLSHIWSARKSVAPSEEKRVLALHPTMQQPKRRRPSHPIASIPIHRRHVTSSPIRWYFYANGSAK